MWPRRLLRAVLGLVLTLLVILLITWVALPLWIERQGVRMASEQLGRPVSLTAAHFSPWRLALNLEGLRIAGPNAQAPDLLAVKQLEVALSPRSVLHLAPILSSLRIEAPTVRLALLGDGRTDVDDILARLNSQPQPAAETPAKEPDLALYNIELTQGDIQLDDRHAGMVHRLSGLQLGVPFLSTLDADVEVTVQPHLAGQLNGVPFQTEAQAQPFAQTRAASLQFKLDGLDLSAYRAYWPKALPMRLATGLVDAHLTVDFRQPLSQPPALKISGDAQVRELALQRRVDGGAGAGAAEAWEDWLRWKRVTVALADLQPLKRQVLLDRLSVQAPELRLTRDAQGKVWLPVAQDSAAATPAARPAAAAASASQPPQVAEPLAAHTSGSAPAGEGAQAPGGAGWRFGLRQLALVDGRVSWQDAALTPAAQWRVEGLTLMSSGLAWPLAGPAASVELSASLTAGPSVRSSGGTPSASVAKAQVPAKRSGKTATSVSAAAMPPTAKSATSEATPGATARANASTTSGTTPGTTSGTTQGTTAGIAPVANLGTATLRAKGTVGPNGVTLDWGLQQLSLAWLAPYLHPVTPLEVAGQLAVQGQVTAGPKGEDLKLGLHDLRLADLTLLEDRKTVASLAELTLDKADLALATQEVSLGRLTLKEPQARLARDAQGRWNWAGWTRSAASGQEAASSHARAVPATPVSPMTPAGPAASAPVAAPAWRARVAELLIEGGQVQLLDQLTHVLDDEPVRPIGVQELAVRVAGVDWDGHQLRQALPVRISMVARRPDAARRSARETPRLQWDGQVALAPVRINGKLLAEHLPLHWADPYLDPSIGIHLQRAEGNFKGDVSLALLPAGPRVQAVGDLLLADLRLRQARLQEGRRRSAEDLLSWQALRLSGFKLQLAPAGVPDINIRQASLDEFYARLIINEQGRLNLRDLRQTEQGQAVAAVAGTAAASAPVAATVAAATSASTPVATTDAARTTVASTASQAVSAAASPAAASAAAPAASGPPLRLSIQETRVNAGQVDFNDRFVKPNYSARLSELTGTLGGFSAGSEAMAPLQLRGRVAGTGLLDISGQLNPSGAPLALDITASATDIELAPLSPYAGKYAGYAIERGKLSSRVHYQIDPAGRLVADNKIVLNQLSFGERIDSPDATRLPVRLAVALLKDSNGVIDVNLPVSGSINDPAFSIGGVVVKLIVNLLTKALTAPFSLLSGGGGGDMSHLDFTPGTAVLPPATERGLDSVAKVLTEKPSLQLSITGWVDPAAERRAAQAARLEEALLTERRRELRRQQTPESAAAAAGTSAQAPASAPPATSATSAAGSATPVAATPITLDDTQRQRLLKTVYDNAKLPNKPRNLLGLAKDLPPAEMRELLMDSYTVTDEQMRELALQRSVAVRDALITKGVPNARLFLASPMLHESKDGQGWQPRVDLSLTAQ
ncbi:protein of unknown function [Roseateles sp. YR242]|uniref:DUF748 domain-containing protein n=1 Tax=Roseateles sp. YR242 TaxID=1855305 RepID=UPI0008B0A7CB|nr:DUF748 domain-containing protein [Roseateles sp. YR242]SEL07521.1 protein of unknown function [Roseateles sp. YR242]